MPGFNKQTLIHSPLDSLSCLVAHRLSLIWSCLSSRSWGQYYLLCHWYLNVLQFVLIPCFLLLSVCLILRLIWPFWCSMWTTTLPCSKDKTTPPLSPKMQLWGRRFCECWPPVPISELMLISFTESSLETSWGSLPLTGNWVGWGPCDGGSIFFLIISSLKSSKSKTPTLIFFFLETFQWVQNQILNSYTSSCLCFRLHFCGWWLGLWGV